MQIADTLTNDFDPVGHMTIVSERCAELLGEGSDVGVMVRDEAGKLRTLAASTSAAETLELFDLQSEQGPGADCVRSGRPLIGCPIGDANPAWPDFGRRAYELGYRTAHAMPMRLRADPIGVISVLQTDDAATQAQELDLLRPLADVTTIALLQYRNLSRTLDLAQQLQEALDSRVVIEQAKGVLSARLDCDMQRAFDLLRRYARSRNQTLADVAADVLQGKVSARDLQQDGGLRA